MNLRRVIVCTLAALCFCNGGLVAKEKVNPSGTWRWEYEMQGETRNDALTLNLGDDGKTVTGQYDGNGENQVEIKEGKFEGNTLSLMVPLEIQGTSVVVRFSGTIEKDSLDGTVVAEMDGETYDFPWAPTRSVKSADLLGEWNLEIVTDEGQTMRPTLKVAESDSGDLTAEYTSQIAGELDVERIDIKDNHLVLTVTTNYEGTAVRIDFKARPYGDKMNGLLEYDFGGQTGEREFKAARKKKKKS